MRIPQPSLESLQIFSLFTVILYFPSSLRFFLIHKLFLHRNKMEHREVNPGMASSQEDDNGFYPLQRQTRDAISSPARNTEHIFHSTPGNYDYLDGRSFNYSEVINATPQASQSSFNQLYVSSHYPILSKLMLVGTRNSWRKNLWS